MHTTDVLNAALPTGVRTPTQALRTVQVRPWVACGLVLLACCQPQPGGAATPAIDVSTAALPAGCAAYAGTLAVRDGSVYRAGFAPTHWSGTLKKMDLIREDNGVVRTALIPAWDAAAVLTGDTGVAATPAPLARKIFTAQTDGRHRLMTVPFSWDALSTEHRTVLDRSPVTGLADGSGQDRLAYLRGDRTLEGASQTKGQASTDKVSGSAIFRNRISVLGDMINSVPLVVGAPADAVRDAAYQAFSERHRSRRHAIYIGANDGMLHAFDAATGGELFAFVPPALMPGLNRLTATGYQHQPGVDGELAASEAIVKGEWKTVLAAAMRGGAQGVFALDVSDPADFAAGAGLFLEFTDRDDPDMGNVIGAPHIAKFRIGTTLGVPRYRYFVVVSSGLNNYRDDGAGRFRSAPGGALILLSLDKEPSAAWTEGLNYYKFRTTVSDLNSAYGLAAPALVPGADGAVRLAYAGDLQGNLWRFDFRGLPPWTDALGAKLFTARNEAGMAQPVSTRPRIVFAPGGGYLALFGTGKWLEQGDTVLSGFTPQSYYAVHDPLRSGYSVAGRSELALRTVGLAAQGLQGATTSTPAGSGTTQQASASTITLAQSATPASAGPSTSPTTGKAADRLILSGDPFQYGEAAGRRKGWYFDFLDSGRTGERSISDSLVDSGRLFFNTLLPGASPCFPATRSYELDPLTGLPAHGGPTGLRIEEAVPGMPIVLRTGMEVLGGDAFGRRTVRKKYAIVSGGMSGTMDRAETPAATGGEIRLPAGRLSWRELIDWDALHRAASGAAK